MQGSRKWKWSDFLQDVSGGILVGTVAEVAAGGAFSGTLILGGAAGGAVQYTFNWIVDNIRRGKDE